MSLHQFSLLFVAAATRSRTQNTSSIVLLDPIVDSMAGTLTIYGAERVATPGGSFAGQCWIEYEPISGPPITYGAWGNNPDGVGTRLIEKLEPGRAGVAQRSVYLDDLQETRLLSWIQRYRDKGNITRVPQIDLPNLYLIPGTQRLESS